MASSARKRRQLEDGFGSFEFQFQTQKRIRSSRVSETQRNVAVQEKSTVSLCKGLVSSATKNANPESEEGFDEICQTQKRKRSSRVSETQRNEKSTIGLPLRKAKGLASSASKETIKSGGCRWVVCERLVHALIWLSFPSFWLQELQGHHKVYLWSSFWG
ncbi:bromodomain-containing factor 1 isoform X1 [Prunus yedoensis var. nudiflora]|uniref:Bromodomain-containing factor 1 isoform X1 n=1 Tax=Prunus yedoensis var. nudiflora TaxID=2094558 RepID=A0A314ZLE8_PRUYE|nr:bromodomain-containing factor 1 isoform X1 [Prunus yedoensis var. nudiflora]